MKDFITPLMKQYQSIKNAYPDCLLFFRLGDFYELFLEDASIGAQILDITLTSRPEGADGRVPMAGIPYHAVDSYLAKLVKAGYKVAICEQLSEPSKKGIVERDVVRVVTPGTLIDEKALEKKEHNYITAITLRDNLLAITIADLSTGECQTQQIESENIYQSINDELAKIQPSECILSEEDYNDINLLKVLNSQKNLNIFAYKNWEQYSNNARQFLLNQFKIKSLNVFGIEDKKLSQESCAALIGYLKETQKDQISHIKKITLNLSKDFVYLDKSTIINLELFSTIRDRESKGSLLSTLDKTQTAMGGRLLKHWLIRPLRNADLINQRYDVIEELTKNYKIHQQILEKLEQIPDLERITARLSVGIGNARDLINLKLGLEKVLQVKKISQSLKSDLLVKTVDDISYDLQKIIFKIDETINDEPPISLREGGLIKSKYSKKLDELRDKVGGGKKWILDLEVKEKEKTGITTLKVRFNKVFGFYIEVSKSHVDKVPNYYMRKQTLVNGERFITPELKQQEELILNAQSEINEIEYNIFQYLLKEILSFSEKIQQASKSIATIDCLSNFTSISKLYHYKRPKIIYSGEINIKNGRHPVVENLLERPSDFIPNDCLLSPLTQQLLIITGPNMAGKSVYIRQVALIVLMAQLGCFIPVDKAYITLVDKIFVRSGASDVITSGLSTFMVEMTETASILSNATSDSLIIMDEIGRGTSTYDGISIAWAVAEYLVTEKNKSPKTLFATHYHELQELEEKYPKKIKNYHMAVKNTSENEDPIFLHTIMIGAASHSFGVAVAKLAGIPEEVIDKALEKLNYLESSRFNLNNQKSDDESLVFKEILDINTNNLTPIEALNILDKLTSKLKNN